MNSLHGDPNRFPERVLVFAALAASFLILCTLFLDFVIDDAYIAYRYSKHLAEGHGFSWNVGERPVEGFTSLLWVLLHAVPIRFGVDPLGFSRIVSVVAVFGIVAILVRGSRHVPAGLALAGTGAIAWSPAFAVVTLQGLETAGAALFLAALAASTISLAAGATLRGATGWFAIAFFAALARPDTIAFSGAAFLGLVVLFARRGDGASVRRLTLAAVPFLVLGALVMVWRVATFDSIFPNPFLVKSSSEAQPNVASGPSYIASFLLEFLLPFLVVFLVAIGRRIDRRRLGEAAPVLFACLAFGAAISTIRPIQGYAWRFLQPALPALLYAGFHAISPSSAGGTWMRRAAYAALILFLAAWSQRTIPDLRREQGRQSTLDRVAVGKSLAGMPGKLFTGSAGALPYYSDWWTVDRLGLTSREIAREGLSIELLEELHPDLVTVRSDERGLYTGKLHYALVNRYLVGSGFVTIAAVRRPAPHVFFYFARPDSPLFDEIVRRVRGTPGIEFADPAPIVREKRIPILENAALSARSPGS